MAYLKSYGLKEALLEPLKVQNLSLWFNEAFTEGKAFEILGKINSLKEVELRFSVNKNMKKRNYIVPNQIGLLNQITKLTITEADNYPAVFDGIDNLECSGELMGIKKSEYHNNTFWFIKYDWNRIITTIGANKGLVCYPVEKGVEFYLF